LDSINQKTHYSDKKVLYRFDCATKDEVRTTGKKVMGLL
jgi:hypothetical protein